MSKKTLPKPVEQNKTGSGYLVEPVKFEANFIKEKPFYVVTGAEERIFLSAAFCKDGNGKNAPLPVLLKGPTGCGKTRFIEYMAWKLKRPLITIHGHDELSKDDLVGRYILEGLEGKWRDGPLLTALKCGAIFYFDEMVEARSDTTVATHGVTDHRRSLSVDILGSVYGANLNFMFTGSYNPGYQNLQKRMKPSTKQRYASITMDYPSPDLEIKIIQGETGIDKGVASGLVEIAKKIRSLKTESGTIEEGASTRLLVNAAKLLDSSAKNHIGLSVKEAYVCAIRDAVTDDSSTFKDVEGGINDLIDAYFES